MAKYIFNTDYYVSEWFGNLNPTKTSYKKGDEIEADFPTTDFNEQYYKQFLYEVPKNTVLSNYDGTEPSFDNIKNNSFGFIFIPRDYLNKVIEGSTSTSTTDNQTPNTKNRKYFIIGGIAILVIASTIIYFATNKK